MTSDPPETPGPAPRPGRRPVGGSFAGSMLNAAARSTGLIALAVAIGVVLLQLSDDSTEPLAAGGEAVEVDAPRRTTTTTGSPESTTTTTAKDEAAEDGPPASAKDLTVLVLNGSGRNNQARPLSERLRVVGYQILEPGNASPRDASVVLCRAAHAGDASALVAATGLTAEVDELDDTNEFPDSEDADCIVVIGAR